MGRGEQVLKFPESFRHNSLSPFLNIHRNSLVKASTSTHRFWQLIDHKDRADPTNPSYQRYRANSLHRLLSAGGKTPNQGSGEKSALEKHQRALWSGTVRTRIPSR